MVYKALNFDMDGTLADLYGQRDWLKALENQRIDPYLNAKPLVNMSTFARYLNTLQRMGYQLNIVSWNSRGASYEYAMAVKEAKLEWLKRHLPSVKWDNVYVVTFGTPKHSLCKGILFDDDYGNCFEWMDSNAGDAYHPDDIMIILKELMAIY